MFIAMNRFKVVKGQEQAFEQRWLERDSYLDQVPGFVVFHLLRGPEREDYTLYSSHTTWTSKQAFTAWTQSEPFRAAHRDAGSNRLGCRNWRHEGPFRSSGFWIRDVDARFHVFLERDSIMGGGDSDSRVSLKSNSEDLSCRR